MTLSRFNPIRDLASLRSDIDQIFDDFFSTPMGRSAFPAVRVLETNDAFMVSMLVPGLDRQNLDIQATPNSVSIRGRVQFDVPEGMNVRHSEYGNAEFRRTLQLGTQIRSDSVKASYQDGILMLNLPKSESGRVVRVALEGGVQQPQMIDTQASQSG